ncbi:hypothetical protein A374_13555 [Fictibacillus macauensis ZFHKF-1]|uniref:Spore germination protein n=1 Tax=Fictibacillus macauensis ZFHKF-1 TaxID=1196324 RepID=I8IZ07_9BACL|nr:spore germination protein [Fictibacillus macauensis]EIT84721.1 hypothetical protein A374_13555 [Fictibacillus macauensis ZFHKF-1]
MGCIVNIYYLKVNSLASNSSLNLGSTLHKDNMTNSKSVGDNYSSGDYSPTEAIMKNVMNDQDINDQGQSANSEDAE